MTEQTKTYRFSVREVADRIAYVEANTYAEARAKLDQTPHPDVILSDIDDASYRRTVRPLGVEPEFPPHPQSR
jgi:hypothetical protein